MKEGEDRWVHMMTVLRAGAVWLAGVLLLYPKRAELASDFGIYFSFISFLRNCILQTVL